MSGPADTRFQAIVEALAWSSPIPAGRPSGYDPKYCAEVITDMRLGYSLGGFAGKIGVSKPTINNWKNQYPEFAEAVAIAMAQRQRMWEQKAQEFAFGHTKLGNPTILIFGLRNAGAEDWQDIQQLNVKSTIDVTVGMAKQSIEQKLQELADKQRLMLEEDSSQVVEGSPVASGEDEH